MITLCYEALISLTYLKNVHQIMTNLLGAFIILHGLVYLLYFGHGIRYFKLALGME